MRGNLLAALASLILTATDSAAASKEQCAEHDIALVQVRASKVGTARKPSPRPHILFALADDLGWNSVGWRNKQVQTPFLDELAHDGVILNNYYSGAVCAPSRFSLLTGRNPFESEGWGTNNLDPQYPVGTSLKHKMLPAVLKEAGYATHMVGKWHQGFHRSEFLPTHRGFDTFFGILSGETNHFTQQQQVVTCNNEPVPKDICNAAWPANWFTYNGTSKTGDARYAEVAADLVRKHDVSKPMFLFLSLQYPHAPWQVPVEYSSRFTHSFGQEVGTYFGMLAHMDQSVREVVGAIKEKEMYDNTLIIFASDNGAHRPSCPYKMANAPLKGGKGQLNEGGVRVPAFVSGGFLPPSARGKIATGLMSTSDWYATLANLAGAQHGYKEGNTDDVATSIDNWNFLIRKQERSAREELVQLRPSPPASNSTLHGAIIRDGFKLLFQGLDADSCKPSSPCLYDLESDPAEEHDISSENPRKRDELRDKLNRWVRQAESLEFFMAQPEQDITEGYQKQSCAAWYQGHGGFLGTWAPNDSERNYLRVASRRPAIPKELL